MSQVICDARSDVTLAKKKILRVVTSASVINAEQKHVPRSLLFGKPDPGLIWHDHVSTHPLIIVREDTIPRWSACKFYLFASRLSFASIASMPARPLPDSI